EPYARAVAERLGTEHRQFTFTSGDAAALFPRLGELLDEPLADPAFLPTVHLARHIREWVTVALSGDGRDELLCGHPTVPTVEPDAVAHPPAGGPHQRRRPRRRGLAGLHALRHPELPPQAVLPRRRSPVRRRGPDHDERAQAGRAGEPRRQRGPCGERRG